MKILQIFDWFSPQHGGGTVDIVYKLSQGLAQRGHEVVIYTSDFEMDQEYIDSLKEVKVYPFHCTSNLGSFYLTPEINNEMKRWLGEFDVIHSHCSRSYQNIVMHHYAKKYNIPYIIDCHGSLPKTHGRQGQAKWLLKSLYDAAFGNRIMRDTSSVVAENALGVKEYQEFGVTSTKISIIPHHFATEQFSNLPPPGRFRTKYGVNGKHIVMFLGRIHWIKGLDFLVESFSELARQRDDVILVIVGPDDGDKHKLVKLINKLNLQDKVLFTGFLGGVEKLSALVDADIVVQTSRYEQGAGVPFEALLCDTPIIVSKHTGAGEQVREIDAGYLVEYGNKDELITLIRYVLDHPAEAKEKSNRARDYIATELSIARMIEKYEKLYEQMIQAKGRKTS